MSSDQVSYYACISEGVGPGPVGLARRLPHHSGGYLDEMYMGNETWAHTSDVAKYYSRPDDDESYIPITRDEAHAFIEWRRDRTAQPPIIGGWSVGTAWSVLLKGDALAQLIERLDLIQHGALDDQQEHDPAFRVLRNDSTSRVTLNILRARFAEPARWIVAIDYLREGPSDALVHEITQNVNSVAVDLGFEKEDERWDIHRSETSTPWTPEP